MVKTLESREVIPVAPELLWAVSKRSDTVLPMLIPQLFAKIVHSEGNGGAGTIRTVTLGPVVPGNVTVKERVEVFDEATKTVVYSTIEGDPRYSSFKSTVKYLPGPTAGTTEAIWTAEYTAAAAEAPPPEELKNTAQAVLKALAAYASTNPDFAA